MIDNGYQNYRVRYLSHSPSSQTAKRDPLNPELWVCDEVLPAVNGDQALAQIIQRGDIPVYARIVRNKGRRVAPDYKLKFMLSIHFAVQAGVSAGSALERTIEAEPWPDREMLEPALRLLRSGATFSEAITLLELYDETTLAILMAGEQTGSLPQAFNAVLSHLQRKQTADGLLKGAIGAISLDIVMAMSSSISAVVGLLPQAEKQGLQTKDPAVLERWHNAIHIGYVSNYILLAGAVVALLFGVMAWVMYQFGDREAREKVETFLRKMPFLGDALVHDAVAVSTMVTGYLLRGGVMFTNACEITIRSIKLPIVQGFWRKTLEQVMAGVPVGEALSREPLNSAEQRVVAAHCNQTQLAEAFEQIGSYRQQQAEKANKRFIVMGLVMSFLYSGLGIASTLYVNWVQITGLMSSSGL